MESCGITKYFVQDGHNTCTLHYQKTMSDSAITIYKKNKEFFLNDLEDFENINLQKSSTSFKWFCLPIVMALESYIEINMNMLSMKFKAIVIFPKVPQFNCR